MSQHDLRTEGQNTKALAAAVALAWFIPLAALIAAMLPINHAASRHPLVNALISRCRFTAVPADDIERLGLWCRDHTPQTPASSDRRGQRRSGSGRDGAWPSTAQPAPTMPPAWPTGSRDFRTTWIFMVPPPSSCVLTSTTAMVSKHATRRKATRIGRPGSAPGGDLCGRRGPKRP